jgi:DNA-binding MarR family transcriptional regulator
VDRRHKRVELAREGARLLTLFDAARAKAAAGLLAKLPAATQARLDAAVREALKALATAATPTPVLHPR